MKDMFAAARPTTLADYIGILRRRIWIIILMPVIAAAVAYGFSRTQSPRYEANAVILVSRTSIVSAISNVSDPTMGDASRFLTTVASIARSPELAGRVVAASKVPGLTAGSLLADSNVTARSDADLLDISVGWRRPSEAARIANAYATEFTRYKTELDTAKINDALRSLQARINALKKGGQGAQDGYNTLLQEQTQLETIGTLLANNTSVLTPASGAAQVEPRPMRSAILGALLGGVLGLGLAFAAEALDRRVRAAEEIEHALGIPLLGRVPRPSRLLRDSNRLIMLADPTDAQAENYRKLKTTIEYLNLERGARTLMVTSALPGEGKSTTVANLAVAFMRSGRQVSLVDLDLRRPFLHSFFPGSGRRGITDVILGKENLAGAIYHVPGLAVELATRHELSNGNSGTAPGSADRATEQGMLNLIAAGTTPSGGASLVDVLENERLGPVLSELAAESEIVLIDTPPLLAVGDAMALTRSVDAILLVLHAGIEAPLLHEVARQLQISAAPVLGFIMTGVSDADSYGYGYDYYSGDAHAKARPGAERV